MAIRRYRREDLENQLNRGALWAVTYGDLMSYLMIFFLILFTFSMGKSSSPTTEKKQYHASLVSIQKVFGGKGSSADYERMIQREREESMVSQLKQSMDKSDLSQYAKIETWDKKVRLVLADAVMFDSGQAKLKKTATKVLSEVATQIKTVPNPVVVEGHTDNMPVRGGAYSSNWELSMARAYAVLRFFEEQGISPNRLAGIGYGQYKPQADNMSPEGRAKNRRIEIDLIREE